MALGATLTILGKKLTGNSRAPQRGDYSSYDVKIACREYDANGRKYKQAEFSFTPAAQSKITKSGRIDIVFNRNEEVDINRIYFIPAPDNKGLKLSGKDGKLKTVTIVVKGDIDEWKANEGRYTMHKDYLYKVFFIDVPVYPESDMEWRVDNE